MSTLTDLSPVTTLNDETLPGSWGTKSPAARNWKTPAEPCSLIPPLTTQPPASSRSTLASICIVVACTSAQVMSIGLGCAYAIDISSAGKDLHIPKEDLQWILSAYSISSACFLLPCGRLADLYGRKRMWLIGYSILVVFGIGAGFAQSAKMLDAMRGLQGIGSAAVVPASLGILAKSFPPGPSRSIAFSTFSVGAPIGAVFSTVLGGVLTQVTKATWRTPTFLFSGIGLAFMILGFFIFEKDVPSTEEDKRVDWIGAALITAGLVLIVFVLSDVPTVHDGWKNLRIIALFVVGVLLVFIFVAWQYYLERRLEDPDVPRTRWSAPPLMKLSLWTRAHGRFAAMQVIACVNWAAFSTWILWAELYYQTYLDLSPIQTVFRLLPMSLSGAVANVLIALIIGRVKVMYIVATGTLMTGCANLLFALIDPSASYWAFGFPAACIIVIGADFTFASGTLFIAKVCLPHEQSVGGAMFQAMTQIGSAIGVSLSTIVFNSVLAAQSRRLGITPDAQADNVPLPAQLKAYKAAMWIGFAFGMLCLTLCMFLRGAGIVGQKRAQDSPARPNPEEFVQMDEMRHDSVDKNDSFLDSFDQKYYKGSIVIDLRASKVTFRQ
ncbi:MFS general substrate transporter [Lactarius quietus]|nr:MFS general substrate transporter [Lactarius quietus]